MNIEIIIKNSGIYGGVQRLYCIAEYLIEAKHTVVVNMADGSKNSWFWHQVPENKQITSDLVIMPETHQVEKSCKKLLYYQAQFDKPSQKYDKVITTSPHLQNKLTEYGRPADQIIPYGFDCRTFHPHPQARVQGKVGYMPRKNKSEAELVKSLLAHDKRVTFQPIDNLSQNETASIMRTCDIFMAISRVEGFGIIPFEAMLSGCLVVGYHGQGGKEWMTNENAILADSPVEIAHGIALGAEGLSEHRRNQGISSVLNNLSVGKEKQTWVKLIQEMSES